MERVELELNVIDFSDDMIFRAFLGAERFADSLRGLLNAILREARLPQIKSLTIKNPYLFENWQSEKEPILDIRVVDEEGREYDVEMQCRREKHYVSRAVFYTFRMHSSQLEQGQGYGKLKRTIGISLTKFPIERTRPDVWFDVWKYRSVLGTDLGYDDAVNIFVRLPSKRGEEPIGVKDPELLNWLKFLAFYPNLTEEELARIQESTSGVTELCQGAEMFPRTKEEHEFWSARERYWHDRASVLEDYEEYEKQINSLTAENSSLTTEVSSLTAANSSLTAANSSLTAEISSRLNSERKLIAKMLQVRFGAPVANLTARLNKIESSETLDRLSDLSAVCNDYDAFLTELANYVE